MIKLAVLLVLVAIMLACAPAPRVGSCAMPPLEHDGHRLEECAVRESDASNVCCRYGARGHVVVVCTTGCDDWTIAYDSSDKRSEAEPGEGSL
jgi:hypothetical protein